MIVLTSAIAFICFFGGGLLGTRLRVILPEEHLADDSRHLLETGLGIIGTVGGLVLGLLVGSAFGSFNAERAEVVQLSANIVVLDRVLAHYGPEASRARLLLRVAAQEMHDDIWTPRSSAPLSGRFQGANSSFADDVEGLNPGTDNQRMLKGIAAGLALSVAQTRWQMYEQLQSGLSPLLVILLIFWFTITFVGLGIFTKPNLTVVATLFLASLAVAGAIYLLQAMCVPFQGAVQISDAPLRAAIAHLGR